MELMNVENQVFEKMDYSEIELPKGEYDHCTFVGCIFSNSDLSEVAFVDCEFDNCDFSMGTINNTAFKEVRFANCKLLGLDFQQCNDFLFSVYFEDCILNFASFRQLKLKNTTFKNCSLHEADFTETDLTGSLFENCDLSRAIFESTMLEQVDFRTSYNYSINPEINRIQKAKFSLAGVAGLLEKYNIDLE